MVAADGQLHRPWEYPETAAARVSVVTAAPAAFLPAGHSSWWT
jgi:hypothetical protein